MYRYLKTIWKRIKGYFTSPPIIEAELPSSKETTFLSTDYAYEFIEDFPSFVEQEKIYIIGENNYYWALVFLCPCGCSEKIQLNVLDEASPYWKFSVNDDVITIKPSIWRNSGCKSHFFIDRGNVSWAKDE
jgi:Family of unknown function (DUF6527)